MSVTRKEKRNKMLIVVFGSIIMIVLFFYLMDKDTKKAKQEAIDAQVQDLLGSDIEMDYPTSPRQVIMEFNKIIVCYYEKKLDDETIKKLMTQERVYFDQELLDNNTFENQFKDLKAEIEDYRKADRTIVNCAVAKGSSVEYWTKDDREYASILSSYTLKDSEVVKTYEKYILRKDDQGKWRILGWEISEPKDLNK